MIYSPKEITEFGTILGIWAHPDDEVFSSGGLIASVRGNGQKVILITATDGAAGETSDQKLWPKENLSQLRKNELKEAQKYLGVPEHHWLGCSDGELEKQPPENCANQILEILEGRKIDTIITFEETGVTGHPDHISVHKWANQIAYKLGINRVLYATENREFYNSYGRMLDKEFNVYFKVKYPVVVSCESADVCLSLNDDIANKKLKALESHKSQTSGLMNTDFGLKAMQEMCRRECFMLRK